MLPLGSCDPRNWYEEGGLWWGFVAMTRDLLPRTSPLEAATGGLVGSWTDLAVPSGASGSPQKDILDIYARQGTGTWRPRSWIK